MARTEVANDPANIAKRPLMRSINSALQIDLFAQSNASFINQRVYSGFGGQPDFVSGALHSPGGEAILALHSWQRKIDQSNVVPLLNNPVCSFQHSMIVSEQGTATLFGRSQAVQARHIIDAVAHPRAREELREAAKQLSLF
jgi:acyl-CoA hydrolase